MQVLQNGEPASPQHFNAKGCAKGGECSLGSHLLACRRTFGWATTGPGPLVSTLGVHLGTASSNRSPGPGCPLDDSARGQVPGVNAGPATMQQP